jgi:pimeloyl-ACP methyl ester carboxylesterase
VARARRAGIPDAGHAPWFDEPARVADAIEAALAADA